MGGRTAPAPSPSSCAGLPQRRVKKVTMLAAHSGAQPCDRLRVHLADARFGYSEHRGDLAKIEVLLVVEAHQLALALGQLLDGLDQRLAQAAIFQARLRLLPGPRGAARPHRLALAAPLQPLVP